MPEVVVYKRNGRAIQVRVLSRAVGTHQFELRALEEYFSNRAHSPFTEREEELLDRIYVLRLALRHLEQLLSGSLNLVVVDV